MIDLMLADFFYFGFVQTNLIFFLLNKTSLNLFYCIWRLKMVSKTINASASSAVIECLLLFMFLLLFNSLHMAWLIRLPSIFVRSGTYTEKNNNNRIYATTSKIMIIFNIFGQKMSIWARKTWTTVRECVISIFHIHCFDFGGIACIFAPSLSLPFFSFLL